MRNLRQKLQQSKTAKENKKTLSDFEVAKERKLADMRENPKGYVEEVGFDDETSAQKTVYPNGNELLVFEDGSQFATHYAQIVANWRN